MVFARNAPMNFMVRKIGILNLKMRNNIIRDQTYIKPAILNRLY
jgi:hypothetical protein